MAGRPRVLISKGRFLLIMKTPPAPRPAMKRGGTQGSFYPSTRQDHVKMGDFLRTTRQISRQEASGEPSGRRKDCRMAPSRVAEPTPGGPPEQRANARPVAQKTTPKRTISDVSL